MQREYRTHREIGVLPPEARVELIEGEIIDMAPIGKNHGSIVDRLTRMFVLAVGERAIVRVQGLVRMGELSEPESDLTLLRPRADFYRDAAPGAADGPTCSSSSRSPIRRSPTTGASRCRSTRATAIPKCG